jgi:N-acetylmuramoyl-L-alanine amidase
MPFEQTDAQSAAKPAAPTLNITDIQDYTPPSSKTSFTQTADAAAKNDPTAIDVAAANPSSKKTVYLDVGHCTSAEKDPFTGKIDQGFVTEKYTECQVNTAVGKLVAKELIDNGFQVIPTWNPFAAPPSPVPKQEDLQRRNNVVNKDVAQYCDDSIYVSIHHDMDSSKKGGQCVYIAETKWDQSMPLAKSIQSSAWQVRDRKDVPQCINSDTTTQNGLLKGLRGVNSIGVLVEAANAMNPNDRALMTSPAHLQREAKGIAQGVVNYFKLQPGKDRPHPACKRSLG